jgi:RNA polymerase sigma factor FliA
MTPPLCTEKPNLSGAALRAYTGCKETNEPPERNELIQKYLPLVHKIAGRVVTYLKPPLSYEDMVSAGMVGLVTAARDYDPSFGTGFKTYAYIRIKGAILDELRGWSAAPVNQTKRIQNARSISMKILTETGKAPTDEELAEQLGITTEELYEIYDADRAEHFVSLDSFGGQAISPDSYSASEQICTPDRQLEQSELIHELAGAIQQLSEKNRHVILLYYQQHLTMKQIAEVLGITESRVCQLHSSALFNLSVKLRQWKDGI